MPIQKREKGRRKRKGNSMPIVNKWIQKTLNKPDKKAPKTESIKTKPVVNRMVMGKTLRGIRK